MNDVRWSNSAFESIARTFAARTGLTFRPDQRESAERGIRSAMSHAEIADLSEMVRIVEHDRSVLDRLIVELTVGETYFLREPAQCEFIRRHVLPDVIERKGPNHQIRIWSAGCASGEEPYSLGMLCTDAGVAERSHILATDISSLALKKANSATYRPWSLRGDGARFAQSHLHFDGEHYRVNEDIRRLVRFEFLNLVLDVYPSLVTGTQAMDLILCRNVMIYFDHETIRAVAERLYQCLTDGGWLITASGDPPLDDHAPFESVIIDKGVYYRKPAMPARLDDAVSLADLRKPRRSSDVLAERGSLVSGAAPRATASVTAKPASVRRRETGQTRPDPLFEAWTAIAGGQYSRAAELTEACLENDKACALHINALANVDTRIARETSGRLAERHSLSAELHYLHAVLCLELNQESDAIRSAERAVYVDRSLAMAHFLLGSIFQRRGEFESARRAFRNAKNLSNNAEPDSLLPLSDGETARQLAEAADAQLIAIEAALRE